jgi:hypothetical protein
MLLTSVGKCAKQQIYISVTERIIGMQYVKQMVRTLLPVTLGLALLAPVAQAVNYNPATTLTVYIHGFDADGPTSTWLAGDDSPNSDACGMWNDVQRLAPLLGAPTWQQNPTAPNCVCAATYYGSTLPTWYTAQDIADDNAFGDNVVPKYALREAKYIRHCLNRAPGATSVHVMSASFGSLIARYMIEHNVLNLCSDGLISRWSPVVGVLRGNWLASTGSNLYLLALGQIFGVDHADDPDIPQMNYSWVDANISAHDTLNSPYFGPMVFNQFTATDDDAGYITDANNNANDNMNMNTDEYFAGYTTAAALHPATDATLLMPGLAYYRNYHTGVRDNSAMWASLVAAAQSNKRVTIRLSRLMAKGEDGFPYNNKQWVYHATVYSPRSAVLYGNTRPVSDLAWEDGVSPKFSIGQDETINPNTAVFDMIVPPGETQLQLTFTLETLENQYTYYNVLRIGYGGNSEEGTFTLTIPTTQNSMVTVSNGNLEADLSTSIHYVCYQPPVLPQQTARTIGELTLLTVANTATDFNPPGDVLSYQLINPPSGAAIDSNGVITWTPTEAQGSTANTITTVVSDGTSSATNSFVVNVIAPPVVGVITNALTTCGTTCISLGGSVGGCATGGVWTTTGAGSFSPDATTVNASYCPSPADIGQMVTNTLTSQGPCAPYSDDTAQVVVAVITPPAAGVVTSALTTCGTTCISLGGSVGGCATGGVWTTTGAGAFSPDAATVNASYCPSPADYGQAITCTLTSQGPCAPCSDASAQVVVTVITPPTAGVVANALTTCGTNCISLGGAVGGCATGGFWTTAGTGTFTPDASTVNASYCPSAADVAAHAVTVTLTSTGPCAPCGDATAQAVLTIITPPTASAGGNQTIYVGQSTAGLGGSVGGGAAGGVWSASSAPLAGSFSPSDTAMNATYNPSSIDIANGTVTLTLSSTGQLPCPATTAQVVVTITAKIITTTTLDFTNPQTYGSTVLSATVTSTNGASGTVTFMDGTTNLASVTLTNGMASLATNLTVAGSPHAIQAVFTDPASEYETSSASSNLTITAREVTLGGSKTYDGTTTVTPAQGLTLQNNVDGENLSLAPTDGIVYLAGRNAGLEDIISVVSTNISSYNYCSNILSYGYCSNILSYNYCSNILSYNYCSNIVGYGYCSNILSYNYCSNVVGYSSPSRVQVQGATGGSWSSAQNGSFNVGLNGTGAGNTLVAVINTDSDGTGRVSSLSGAGTWTRLGQAENGTSCPWGSETEMWYAPNIGSGATSVTINVNSTGGLTCFVLAEAVVVEYGLMTSSPLDQYSQASGGGSPANSGSANGNQGYEVWVAGLGTANSSGYSTLSGQSSGWTFIGSQSKNVTLSGTGTYNTIYTYDQITGNTTGTASCSANESGNTAWAGVVGTFKGSAPPIWGTPYICGTNWGTSYVCVTNWDAPYVCGANWSAPEVCGTNWGTPYVCVTNWDAPYVCGTNYVYPANVALAGPATPNYTMTPIGAVTIAPTNLTVTAASNTKNYDGTTTATNTPTITAGSIQPGDTAPIGGWTETYDTPDVGTDKTLTPAGLVLDGNDGANYYYTYAPDLTGVISALTTTTLLGSDVNPSGVGANVTFTATVTALDPIPVGDVVFSANNTPFATKTLTGGGNTVTASTTALPAGTNTIVAEYLGGLDYMPSVSDPLSQVVTNNVIYSQTNVVLSVVSHHDTTFTLNFQGTHGAEYYVVYTANIKDKMPVWTPVVGSTNTASPTDGTWSCVVSNPAPAYYCPVAVNPAP